MKKTAFVLGANGFLGRYFCEFFSDDFHVIAADISNSNLKDTSFEFKKVDALDFLSLKESVPEECDVFLNFAGISNVNDAQSKASQMLQTNIVGNINALEACVSNRVKNYAYISSVYASSNSGSFYGISKRCAEQIIEEYHKKMGVNYLTLRVGSVYGPQPSHNNALLNLIKRAVTDKEITHIGNGEEIREYIHVNDVMQTIKVLLNDDKFYNSSYLITGPEKIKRKDLFLMIEETLGEPVKIKYVSGEKSLHYQYTPYTIKRDYCRKFILDSYVDFGEGIKDCINSVLEKDHQS
tara:strand:- start:13109 stop:13993 length:885 start_codon:yes stop_codon:yes gene_type:complete